MTEAEQRLTQAMWDARAILGFDNDGDAEPRFTDLGQYIESFLGDMREMRSDYDDLLEELP